jgi:hypothetical protein
VTVHKTLKVHPIHYSSAEWIDRKKKKMIVPQELDGLDRTLNFIKADGMVDNEKWKTWKDLHNMLTTSWNVLFCQILAPYFAKHLTNKRKLKCACEFKEKFPEVLHLLRNFLRPKKFFRVVGGSAKFKILHGDSIEFGRNWIYQPDKRLSLALMDL